MRKIGLATKKTIEINNMKFYYSRLYFSIKGDTIINYSNNRSYITTTFLEFDGTYNSKFLEYGVYVYAVDKKKKWTRINSHDKYLKGLYRIVILIDAYRSVDMTKIYFNNINNKNEKYEVEYGSKSEYTDGPTISIVTASYNSSEYLDDYFKSLVNTRYKNLEIIFVDDGSIDNTADIVKSYANKLNIKYIYQDNAGQSVARNNGIKESSGEWVIFFDSDDFIDENYFENLSFAMKNNQDANLIITNLIYFNENENQFKDAHPLNYKFMKHAKFERIDLLEKENIFQLFANTTCFKTDKVKKFNLEFPNLKPSFEDAYFVNTYIRLCDNYNIVSVPISKYFYRKRSNNSSTLDLANKDIRKYTSLLFEGYIRLLREYSPNIPKFIQNMVVYEISWNLKQLEWSKTDLTDDERTLREEYLAEIFSLVEYDQVRSSWKYLWKLYQIGINNRYYGNIDEIDAGAYYFYETNEYIKLLLISINDQWTFETDDEIIELGELDYRIQDVKMNNKFFINKYFVKIPKNIKKIYFKNDQVKLQNRKYGFKEKNFTKDSLCIFYDRNIKADDNAEALYEYMMNKHPEFENLYFAIKESSSDYKRLEEKGFKVVDYDSPEFLALYRKADYIFSSAFDKSIENINSMRYESYNSRAKFIFLQHGIIINNLKEWFSGKRVDKIVTSCDFEYNNLVNKYTLFEDEVIKVGLPRYDKLYNDPKNEILIQLTWRMQYQNYDIEQFSATKYSKDIIEIISNEKLLSNLREKGYIIKFIPHPEVNKFLELYTPYENDVIKILNIENIIFRDQFANAKMMITDYSSVFTDFAYLNKKLLFFQDDPEYFYKGHLYEPELSYKENGLGPVVSTTAEVINEIMSAMENNFVVDPIYLERIEKFFAFNDKKNCERLFDNMMQH